MDLLLIVLVVAATGMAFTGNHFKAPNVGIECQSPLSPRAQGGGRGGTRVPLIEPSSSLEVGVIQVKRVAGMSTGGTEEGGCSLSIGAEADLSTRLADPANHIFTRREYIFSLRFPLVFG